MPSSSSHAIIGGLIGAGIAAGGVSAVNWSSVRRTVLAIVASPAVALTVAVLATGLVIGIQRVTPSSLPVPEWAALASYSAIALGTAWGGWKIIDTMGLRLTRLSPRTGVAANIGATTAIFGATAMGIPISTTHAAASSVVGAGVASRGGANWKVIGEMVSAWIATIPATAAIAWIVFEATRLPRPAAVATVCLAVVVLLGGITWAMVHAMSAREIEAEVRSTAVPQVSSSGAQARGADRQDVGQDVTVDTEAQVA